MRIVINGEERALTAPPMTPLADVLRDTFFLTGAKVACGEGFCGACTVLVDDTPMVSCLVPVGLMEGRSIRTVESLAGPAGDLSPLQAAMETHDAVQCGMCFPGILMSLTSLFEGCPGASRDDIRAALAGNICRCTGYERIVEAALSVAQTPAGEAEAAR